MLTSALLVRPVDATELPDASFFFFAMGVFTLGAIIGFLLGILLMMCLKSTKKEDISPKKQDYLPEATPTGAEQDYRAKVNARKEYLQSLSEAKSKEQEHLQYVFARTP